MTTHHPDFIARSKEILGRAHQALSHGDSVSATAAINQHRSWFRTVNGPAEHIALRVKLALACRKFEDILLDTDPNIHL